MSIINWIRERVTDARMENVDINTADRIAIHREILFSKKFMTEVFNEFYKICIELDKKYFTGDGLRVEIGSGSGQFKKYYPDIITTDIVPSPYIDKVLDAQNMDYENSSIHAIYGINCFHHLLEPDKFLKESSRVLKPGGGCILIDPYHGPFSNIVHTYIHAQEHFDKKQQAWETHMDKMGTMSGANQALSYIVFVRDKECFLRKFPPLEIVKILPLNNYLRYLLSGGLNFKQLVPDSFSPVIKLVERILSPLSKTLALHYVIVLRKHF
jgi:SAM-dependent methyltransferase